MRPGRDAELWADAHGHRAPGPGQVPHAGGPGQIQGHPERLRCDRAGRRAARPGPRLGPHPPGLLHAGLLQVRPLRGLQDPLRGAAGPGEGLRVENRPVPGRLGQRRVLRRHGPGAHGGGEGPRADAAGLRPNPAGRAAPDVRRGGPVGLLQGRGAALDAADPLHHDEVRLLRAHRGGPLQVRGAQAPEPVHQSRAARRDLRGRLHCRRLLRHGVPPGRLRRFRFEQGEGQHGLGSSPQTGVWGLVEGPVRPNPHDWHPDGAAVVHLRLGQGLSQAAPPSSPPGAGILPEAEIGEDWSRAVATATGGPHFHPVGDGVQTLLVCKMLTFFGEVISPCSTCSL